MTDRSITTERSAQHASFTIERMYDATPARVFAAFATSAAKMQWFGGPDDWPPGEHQLDFREGGSERWSGGPPGGPAVTMHAVIWDVISNERIVTTYEMHMNGARISVSLNTIELQAIEARTRLRLTEHGVFLDGSDEPTDREHGTGKLLDSLAQYLESSAPR